MSRRDFVMEEAMRKNGLSWMDVAVMFAEGDPAEAADTVRELWMGEVTDIIEEIEETDLGDRDALCEIAYDALGALGILEEMGANVEDRLGITSLIKEDALHDIGEEFKLLEWMGDFNELERDEIETVEGAHPGFVVEVYQEYERALAVYEALKVLGYDHERLAYRLRKVEEKIVLNPELFLQARYYVAGRAIAKGGDVTFVEAALLKEFARFEKATGPIDDNPGLVKALVELGKED